MKWVIKLKIISGSPFPPINNNHLTSVVFSTKVMNISQTYRGLGDICVGSTDEKKGLFLLILVKIC